MHTQQDGATAAGPTARPCARRTLPIAGDGLLGAIGGMVTLGIIGPFIGSVVLAVAYELFRVRLDEDADAGTGTAARGAT